MAEGEASRWMEACATPVVIVAGGRLRYLNPAAARLLAAEAGELEGVAVEEIVPAARREIAGRPLAAVLEERAAAGGALRLPILRRDGVELEVEWGLGRLDDGELVVSLERRVDAPVSADHYRLVFEHAPLGIFHFDESGVITACNDSFVEVIGSSRHLLVGLDMRTLPDERMVRCVLDALRGEATRFEGVYRSVTAGKESWVNVEFAPIRSPEGRVTGGVGIVADVTVARQTEEALQRSNEMLRALFDASPLAIAALDGEARVTMWNPAAQRIYGWRAHEVLGQKAPMIPEARRADFQASMANLMNGQPLPDREVWHEREDGSRFDVRVHAAPLCDAAGRVIGVMAMVDDITDEIRARDERARLLEQEQEARRAAERAIHVRDEFVSIASHELRTPITSLRLTLQHLEVLSAGGAITQVPPHVLARALDRAVRQSRHLGRLVDELLDLSRLDSGRFQLHLEELELGQVVRDAVAHLEPEAIAGGSAITVEGTPVHGRWDRARLQEVATNLLVNALKFGAGKPIEVTVGGAAGGAQLTVRDHGIGIPADRIDRIFDRYERAVSPNHYGGLGLGLYIVRRVVEAHGGAVEVSSREGEGALFTVTLPGSPPGHVL